MKDPRILLILEMQRSLATLRVCDFFDFRAVLGHLTLLLSVSLRTNFQKSHKLSG